MAELSREESIKYLRTELEKEWLAGHLNDFVYHGLTEDLDQLHTALCSWPAIYQMEDDSRAREPLPPTVGDVYDNMTERQKAVMAFLIGCAVQGETYDVVSATPAGKEWLGL